MHVSGPLALALQSTQSCGVLEYILGLIYSSETLLGTLLLYLIDVGSTEHSAKILLLELLSVWRQESSLIIFWTSQVQEAMQNHECQRCRRYTLIVRTK